MKELAKLPKMKLRKLLDGLWLEIVKHNRTRCELCGKESKGLNAHHLISRSVLAYRWDLDNVAVLCAGCHKFKKTSAHVSPWVLYDNLEILLGKERSEYFKTRKNRLDEPCGDLCDIYKRLDSRYYELFGKPYRQNIK